MDLTKLPSSAPMASSGTPSPRKDSMAMPSRPIRLTASVPSTRSRTPLSTSLNTGGLFARHLRQPLFEPGHFRAAGIDGHRDRDHGIKGIGLGPDHFVLRIALQDVPVDLSGLAVHPLPRVEIGHGGGIRHNLRPG